MNLSPSNPHPLALHQTFKASKRRHRHIFKICKRNQGLSAVSQPLRQQLELRGMPFINLRLQPLESNKSKCTVLPSFRDWEGAKFLPSPDTPITHRPNHLFFCVEH